MKGRPNPLLDDRYCVGACGSSQCNIYNDGGYAIDFYKILSYCSNRDDFGVILNSFGVKNSFGGVVRAIFTGNRSKHKRLKEFFKESMRHFFSNMEGCTYLSES